jgi:hypothetical protein
VTFAQDQPDSGKEQHHDSHSSAHHSRATQPMMNRVAMTTAQNVAGFFTAVAPRRRFARCRADVECA